MSERLRVVAAVARDGSLRRIMLAFLGFNMTEYATWIAILVYAYDRGGAAAAGIVALIQLIPSGLVAPFGAFAGDRYRRDRVLFGGYLVQAVALGAAAGALYADVSILLTYTFATVAAASLTFTRPTQASLLPAVTRTPEDLTAANAVSGLAESTGIFLGPFIAGILLTRSEPATVFAVFAVVTLLEALLVARLRVDPEAVTPKERMDTGAVFSETFGGFRVLRHERKARLLVLLLAGGVVVVGALDVLFVAVAIDLLEKGEGWAGFLNSAFGLGGIVGAGMTVALVGRRRLTPPLAGGAFLLGAPIAGVAALPSAAATPLLLAGAGAGRTVSYVSGSTLLQRIAPNEVLSRVFGILEGLAMFALAIGSISASTLVEAFGIQTALIVVGAFIPVVVLVLWAPLLSVDREAEAPDEEALALLRAIPIFAPLPAPAMERLLANVTWVTFPEGSVVIREGDVGDRFYVIAEGAVDITRAGVQLAHRGPWGYFGEIALLRDVPRTATITARYPLRLLALDREPFLEAVTGHPQSREHAEAAATARLSD